MTSALPPFPFTSASVWPCARERNSLRIGSYNVQVDHDRDIGTDKEWQYRRSLAATAVAALDCDLLLIQEPGPGMAEDMKADLGETFAVITNPCDPEKWAGPEAKVGQAFDGNGFVWKPSRLELLGGLKTTWLSTTPSVPSKGEPVAWDSSAFCRTVVDARFKDLQTGSILHAFSAHLDHQGKTARVESAKLVMSLAANAVTQGTIVVVAGDFNTFPEPDAFGPQTYAALSSAAERAGFVDVRAAAAAHINFGVGEDSWKGWPGAKFCRAENREHFPDPQPGQECSRFDQMFVQRSATVQFTGVVEDNSWAAASDHVPIVADFSIK